MNEGRKAKFAELYDDLDHAQNNVDCINLEIEALKNLPESCICDPRDWGSIQEIGPICMKFEPMKDEHELCKTCEHLEECHKREVKM